MMLIISKNKSHLHRWDELECNDTIFFRNRQEGKMLDKHFYFVNNELVDGKSNTCPSSFF